ncbi:MAG: BatA domain-containing protein [Planctomycetota bacterium]
MPFIHPALFWGGLAAASAPIIIHLLNRRRFRIRDWAAMQFLLDSIRKNRRRLRIEELILLLIRTLAVMILGFTIARFTGCGMTNILPTGEGSQTVVYVLDDSYSMGQKAGTAEVFEQARQDLSEQIMGVPKTDKVAIVRSTDPNDLLFAPQFNADPEALSDNVKTFRIRPRRADLPRAMEKALCICRESDSANKRVYLLSDFRKTDVTGRENIAKIKEKFTELARNDIDVVVLDYGRESKGNLTVEKIEMLNRLAVVTMPIRVRVTIRNNGGKVAEGVDVKLTAKIGGGDEVKEFSLPIEQIDRIAPAESRTIEMEVMPKVAGPAVLTAELPADDLATDNQAQVALEVRKAVRVLIVDGNPDVVAKRAGSFYVRTALDPYDDQRYGVMTDVINLENISSARFGNYDLVMLTNVSQFPLQMSGSDGTSYAMLPELEDYVRRGGGLVIWAGEKLNPTFYGEQGAFYDDGSGLLPYPLAPRRTAIKGEFFRIDPQSIAPDSVMHFFYGERAPLTQLVRIKSFSPALELASSPKSDDIKKPRVVARLTDPENSPLTVTRQYGKGSVVLFTVPAAPGTPKWTDWPIAGKHSQYVNVLFDLVQQHSRRYSQDLTAPVGTPIVHRVSKDMLDASVTLETPRYPESDLVSLRPKAEKHPVTGVVQNLVQYERAWEDGAYTISMKLPAGEESWMYYVRNPRPAEGRLDPGKQTDITTAFGSKEYQYKDRAEETGTSIVEAEIDKEYWMWALAALGGLLALETFLAQKFGHYGRS